MPSPAETLARRAARALSPRDFQDAAGVLEREAKRTQERASEDWNRGRRTHESRTGSLERAAARADALRRIADLIRSIGDE